jgi:hypothetical protein
MTKLWRNSLEERRLDSSDPGWIHVIGYSERCSLLLGSIIHSGFPDEMCNYEIFNKDRVALR